MIYPQQQTMLLFTAIKSLCPTLSNPLKVTTKSIENFRLKLDVLINKN